MFSQLTHRKAIGTLVAAAVGLAVTAPALAAIPDPPTTSRATQGSSLSPYEQARQMGLDPWAVGAVTEWLARSQTGAAEATGVAGTRAAVTDGSPAGQSLPESSSTIQVTAVRPDDRAEPRGPGATDARSLVADDGVTVGDLRAAGLIFGVSSPGIGVLTRSEVMRLLEPRSAVSDPGGERFPAARTADVAPAGMPRGELMQLREPPPPIVAEPTYVSVPGGAGFDWPDAGAGIGIGVGASAALLLGGLLVLARRRSTFADS